MSVAHKVFALRRCQIIVWTLKTVALSSGILMNFFILFVKDMFGHAWVCFHCDAMPNFVSQFVYITWDTGWAIGRQLDKLLTTAKKAQPNNLIKFYRVLNFSTGTELQIERWRENAEQLDQVRHRYYCRHLKSIAAGTIIEGNIYS